MMGGTELDQVDSYKYLGLDFKANLSWSVTKDRLARKAKARLAIVRKAIIEGISMEATEGLWAALIRPILEYGCELWGATNWPAAEQIQREVGRRLLGMNSKAADEAIRGDLGWWTMKGRRDFARLKFWHKIVHLPEDRLLKQVYKAEKASIAGDRSSWVFATKKLLTELQLAHIWESEATGPASAWQVLIREAIKAREIAAWDSGIEKKPKLRTYRTLKTAFGREDYLALPPQQRSIIAVMRSGTNSLRIETGRWKREAVEDRICVLCGTAEVEDENHLITACAMYYDLRRRTYETV